MNALIDHDTQQPVEAKTTTALAIVTKAIEEINAVDSTIAALEEKYKGIVFDVSTTEGLESAKKARAEIREPRYALQNMQKAAKKPLNDLKGSIDETTDTFVARIAAIEDPIDLQIKGEELRKETARKAKAAAEAARVAAIEERITSIRELVATAAGQSAANIESIITDLVALAIDESFAEFKQRAETAKEATLAKLRVLHKAAVDNEAAQKKLEEERAELEQQKAEERRVAAIRKRIEAISAYANNLGRLKSAEIDRLITEVGRIEIDATFEELADHARQARTNALITLSEALEDRKAQEAEAERLAREKAEQDAAAAKERARIAEEERAAAARRAEEQRRHDEQLRRQREEEEAKAAERRRILEAEEAAAAARIADQQAELDRQRQALQVSQETVVAPSDPVEAVDGEKVEPAPVVTAETAQTPPRWRPRDEAIIHVVATTWNVSEAVATGWLLDFADRVRAKGEAA